MNDFDSARATLATLTRRGIGMPVAGTLFWLAFAAFSASLPPKTACVYAFFATGVVFPLGWWFTRLAGGDLMAKVQPLTQLGMLANGLQLMYWPVILVVYAGQPQYVPFAMAVLFGSHFLPYAWIYRSRGYAVLGFGAPALAIAVQVLLPQAALVAVPLAVAGVYVVACVLLAQENHAGSAAMSGSVGAVA